EVGFEPARDHELAQLAHERLPRAEEQVLRELLRDRAAAADRAALARVRLDRLLYRLPVDPLVAEELLVFGRDHGLDEVARHLAERDDDPDLAVRPALATGL